jgi:hypothetical protein
MKLHDSATRPFYTGCFMNVWSARHEIAWHCDASLFIQVFHERLKCHTRNCMTVRRIQFIPGVSWMVQLIDMKMHDSATRPGLYRVFHERLKCHKRNCMTVWRAQLIPGVSWIVELLEMKLHDSATRPVYTGCFMNGETSRYEITWQCDPSSLYRVFHEWWDF